MGALTARLVHAYHDSRNTTRKEGKPLKPPRRLFTSIIVLLSIVGVCIGLWALLGGFRPSPGRNTRTCPTDPTAPLGTIQGYDASDGHHGIINIWSAYGQPGASVVARAKEGEQVWIVARNSDGGVQIETKGCILGWVDSEFVQ